MKKRTRQWSEYPIGTKAHSVMGGYWEKTKRGWKWCTGAIEKCWKAEEELEG